jgi:hypothetical protein
MVQMDQARRNRLRIPANSTDAGLTWKAIPSAKQLLDSQDAVSTKESQPRWM